MIDSLFFSQNLIGSKLASRGMIVKVLFFGCLHCTYFLWPDNPWATVNLFGGDATRGIPRTCWLTFELSWRVCYPWFSSGVRLGWHRSRPAGVATAWPLTPWWGHRLWRSGPSTWTSWGTPATQEPPSKPSSRALPQRRGCESDCGGKRGMLTVAHFLFTHFLLLFPNKVCLFVVWAKDWR